MQVRTKPKIVVLGSCSVDFTTYAPRLPQPGETIHGTQFTTSFGGKGANQCVAAAKMGGNTYMIARLGDDQWGRSYEKHLKELGVNVDNVHITSGITSGIAQISVADNGENQIVIVPGANSCLSHGDVKKASRLIETADVLVGQLETPFETTLEAFKINKGVKLLNAAPARSDIQEILPICTILCVNETEASLITNISADVAKYSTTLDKLLETGCQTAIITLGEQGAVYSSKHDPQAVHVFCDNVKPVDTTGAGDAFVGALATLIASQPNQPLHQIVGAACRVATISVTKEGTQTSYPSEFNVFDREYKFVKL